MTVFPIELQAKQRVLVAGAGGGYDIFCGLPIALELESKGHDVFWANYSFTTLGEVEGGRWHNDHLLEVSASCSLRHGDYFPERLLSAWYAKHRGDSRPIYCFRRGGVIPTLRSYNQIVENHKIDTVICIDGGVDGIFRGDETDMGTPSMDSISVISTANCNAEKKYYACTAFGTEGAEGTVSHAQALNRMAELSAKNAFLGVGVVLQHDEVGRTFLEAVRFVFDQVSPVRRSIILSTMVAAMSGKFGHVSVHEKTNDTPPWLSPLTTLYWYFDADAVARLKLFYQEVLQSESVSDVNKAIEDARKREGITPYESIPI
jgi:hypothetical protein